MKGDQPEMKRLSIQILTLMFFIVIISIEVPALSEHEPWDCPECGRTGNTGNYCGGCAHPAPWYKFGLGFPMADFETKMQSVIDQANTWTKSSAPQTLDSFPLMADAVFQLYGSLDDDTVTLERNETKYSIRSSIHDLVEKWLGPSFDSCRVEMKYWDNDHWERTELESNDNHNYAFEVPKNFGSKEIRISWQYEWADLGMNLWGGFHVTYYIQEGIIKDDLFMTLYIRNNMGFCMEWVPSFPVHQGKVTNATLITMSSFTQDKIWTLQYDIKTKKLVEIDGRIASSGENITNNE